MAVSTCQGVVPRLLLTTWGRVSVLGNGVAIAGGELTLLGGGAALHAGTGAVTSLWLGGC